ncbi:hypothetical protein ACS0TY_007312 [Phlomoides rotata]
MNHNVETTHVEDGSGGVPEMNHNVETTLVEDGSGEEDCRKDDKLNEVSDDDAQSSNENDAGLLGRGHRKRKLARSKCTPYTDPSKRKKMTNAIQFDAYKVVDSSKKDNLDKWLEKAVDGEELRLPFCNVSRKFFDELLGEEWLMSDNKKADKLHSLATFFTNNRDVSCVNHLVRYVDGESPELGKAWKGCRFLYIPCCFKSHWIALRVDIQERKIEVYNSREESSIVKRFQPLKMFSLS